MAQLNVIRMDRSDAGPVEVSDAVTGTPYHPFLVRDAVVYQMAKARQGTHAVKSRGQITGSMAKLWRQKGTGRARPGSVKSPQRRGGGIVHGPVVRTHNLGMNKRDRKHAMRAALAERIREEGLIVLEALAPETAKTKDFANWFKSMETGPALIVVDEVGENLHRASRNLTGVEVIHVTQLNVYNLLRYPKTIITKAALEQVAERIAP